MSEFLRALLETNLALAAAIALVVAVRKPARRLLGARPAYGLWALPAAAALAVLIPPRLVTTVLPAPVFQTPAPTSTFPLPEFSEAPAAFAPPLALPPFDPDVLLLAAWVSGTLAFALWLAARQRRFMADLRQGQAGPAVVGFLRPRIVTPADFDSRFSKAERGAILAHEQAHLTRQDARVNGLVALIRCLCWFDPLVHLAAHLMRIDQELACDAQVVVRHPATRRTYAEALIKTQLATRPLPLGCYWPSGTLHPLTERIAMLTRPSPTRRGRLAGAALVLALVGGGAVAAWAAQPARARFVTADPPVARLAAANISAPATVPATAPKALADAQPAFGDAVIDSSDYDPDRPVAFRARLVGVSEGLSDVILQLVDDTGRTWLASGVRKSAGRRFAIEEQIGVTLGVTGFRRRGDACDGPCLMIARELAFADGTRLFRGLGTEFAGKGQPVPLTASSPAQTAPGAAQIDNDSRTAALSAGDWRRAAMLGATSAEVVRALQSRGQYRDADPDRATVAINTDGAILRVYNMSPLPPLPEGTRPQAVLGGQNSESFDLPVGALILRPDAPAERKGAPLPGRIPRPPELPPGTFPFAAVFDGNDPIEMTGRISAIDWTNTYVQLTFVDDRNGQVHRIIGGQSIYATSAQRSALRVGRASVRGYRALDKSCSGYCLVHGRDITYEDGARAALSGFTLPALTVPPAV